MVRYKLKICKKIEKVLEGALGAPFMIYSSRIDYINQRYNLLMKKFNKHGTINTYE